MTNGDTEEMTGETVQGMTNDDVEMTGETVKGRASNAEDITGESSRVWLVVILWG